MKRLDKGQGLGQRCVEVNKEQMAQYVCVINLHGHAKGRFATGINGYTNDTSRHFTRISIGGGCTKNRQIKRHQQKNNKMNGTKEWQRVRLAGKKGEKLG